MLITILEWGISILTSGRGKNKIITCGKIHLPCYCLITVVDSWGQKDRGQRKLPAGQGWKLLFAQLPWDSSDTLYVEGGSSGPYLAPVIMLWLYVRFFSFLADMVVSSLSTWVFHPLSSKRSYQNSSRISAIF